MHQHLVYKCPKCLNTLLVSNKMLHDLRCTKENPATYENILHRQSQQREKDKTNNKYPNTVQRSTKRRSIANEDGTMIDITKEKNIRGKEEFIETKYDKEGNILSRRRADSPEINSKKNNFHEFSEYNEGDDNNKYDENYDNNNNTYYQTSNEIKVTKAPPSIVYETIAPQEYVYMAPAKYHPHVTINKPIEETIISNNENLSETVMNDIIRQTVHSGDNSNTTANNYNINMDNLNGYSNNIETTNYNQNHNQNYTTDNYNDYNYNQINNNNYNYNQINNNDYNYNEINNNDYNYNQTSNNNYENNTDFNNQYNYDNQIDTGNNENNENNDVYSNSYQTNDDYSKKDSGDILRKTAGMGSMDFSSYDYKY